MQPFVALMLQLGFMNLIDESESRMSSLVPRAIVGALIFDQQNRVFLMRSSGKFGDQWIVPGGKIDFGESMVDSLVREIREETNLKIQNIRFCGARELIEPSRHFIFLEFTASVVHPDQVILNSEATEYGWFTVSDIKKMNVAKPTLDFINQHGVKQ